jgi:hypothetical protein
MRITPLLCVLVIAVLVYGCSNPSTPAGYVGYAVKEPIAIGRDEFIMTQDGPTAASARAAAHTPAPNSRAAARDGLSIPERVAP